MTRLKDRWRDASSASLNVSRVILATLRTTPSGWTAVVPTDLGLEPPQHARLESSQHNRRCVELGAKRPLDDRVVFRRIDGDETLVGWAKYSAAMSDSSD